MRPAHSVKSARQPAGAIPPRDEIAAFHLMDEPRLVGGLVERAIYTGHERQRIAELAARLVAGGARQSRASTAVSTPSCMSMASPRRRASS